MRKYNYFMEKFWLVVAIATAIYSAYKFGTGDTSAGVTGMILALVTATLSYLRYYMRKRLEREKDNES